MTELHLTLLGSPQIEIDYRPVDAGSRKALALLAYLAVSGRPVSRDSLATLFWPDQDQSRARAYLRNAIWMLSQAGLEPWLDLARETAAVRLGFDLDVAEFERLLSETHLHENSEDSICPECLPGIEKAVSLYRGDFLEGFTLPDCPAFDEWQFFQADRLRGLLSSSLERLVQYYDGQGLWEQGIAHARRWVSLDPLVEAPHRWLMRLYARSGSRSPAIKQYEILRETLDRELGVEPEAASQQLHAEILKQRAQKESGPAVEISGSMRFERPRHNLPAEITSFVGRESELAEIVSTLQPSQAPEAVQPGTIRLLTLTGPGGSGKTRLAIRAASRLTAGYPDGVYFVGLAPLDHPDQVVHAIARTLGLAETPGRPILDTLKESLKTRRLLLVLDNFEHLIPASALVSELLAAAPGLHVLATSREVLHLYGERAYPVPPLALPSTGDHDPSGNLLEVESVQLFIDRAKAARPSLLAGEAEAGLIAEICARLDGLPLAIELAAARLRLFSLETLRNQIGDRFEVLRGGPRDLHSRQQTLRATIDWSYNLLQPGEQQLFARLGVFQGGFSLEAFEQVCGGGSPIPALDGLQSLVEKSLVVPVAVTNGEPRFDLLETIHAYAWEKMEGMGETEEISDRHARFFASLAAEAGNHLRGGPQLLYWLNRLEMNHANLRAALEWCFSKEDLDLAFQMATSLLFFWVRQDHHTEGMAALDRALQAASQAPLAVKARLYLSTGILAYFRQDLETCLSAHEMGLSLFRQTDDLRGLGWSLVFYGSTLGIVHPSRYEEALSVVSEGLDLLHKLGDKPGVIQGLNFLGETARVNGDYDKAKAVYEESLALCLELGDSMRQLMLVQNLALVAIHQEELNRAGELIRQAIQQSLQIHSASQFALSLMTLAGLYAYLGRPEAGARLMGAGWRIFDSLGVVLQPADKIEIDSYESRLQEQLDPQAYQEALSSGASLELDELLTLVQEV